MNKKLIAFSAGGFVFTLLCGTLLHFVYGLSGSNPVVGLFSPVSESVWEHLKMLVFPYLLWSLYEFFVYGKDIPNHAVSKLLPLLAGLAFIPSFFYIYTAICGRDIPWMDILSFVIASALTALLSYLIQKSGRLSSRRAKASSVAGIFVLLILFFVFTFFPPTLGIFVPPSGM